MLIFKIVLIFSTLLGDTVPRWGMVSPKFLEYTMRSNVGFQGCVVRFLKRLSNSLARDLATDSTLVRLAAIQRSCSKGGAQKWPEKNISRRISGQKPAEDCLGSLETFRPAAGNLPEVRKLAELVSQLRSLLNFARSLEASR